MKLKLSLSFIMVFAMVIFTQAQTIEVVGTGVHDIPVTTLTFSDLATIDHVVVEAVYKWQDTPPNGQVNFFDADESYFVDANSVEFVSTDLGTNDYGTYPSYFTATFNSIGTEGITLDQQGNFGGMHSFVAYVYRTDPGAGFVSYADFNHVFMFRNGESNAFDYVIPIDPSDSPRMVHVNAVISEMANDDRICVINVSDGSQNIQQILMKPNMGDALNITPFALNNVAGAVTEITISIYSPPYTEFERGDSFISGAIVLDVEEEEDPDFYCTLTQGYYGNYGGIFNGMTTVEILTDLLATDLVLGENSNSLTLTQNDVDCVILRLPGGGQPKALNGQATCSNPVGIQLHNNSGRFKNILVAQAITFGLNLRLDANLGGLLIDDLPFNLSNGIMNYFGQGDDLNDLFDLANHILGGGSVSGISKGDMAAAMGMINNYFDECASIGKKPPALTFGNTKSDAIEDLPISQNELAIYPNPVSSYATIEFTAKSDNNTTVEVYNLMGSRVSTLFEGYALQGETYSTGIDASDLPAGVYFIVLRNGENMAREKISIK